MVTRMQIYFGYALAYVYVNAARNGIFLIFIWLVLRKSYPVFWCGKNPHRTKFSMTKVIQTMGHELRTEFALTGSPNHH